MLPIPTVTYTRIELFAVGDFDGDGRQDAVVETTSHGDEGNWHEVGLWLLIQGGSGQLQVLREIEL
jgi:hypothetical protein